MTRTPIYFESIPRQETPEDTTRRLGDALDNDIRNTIRKIYSPLQRQASDAVVFVCLALFLSTIAIVAQLVTAP